MDIIEKVRKFVEDECRKPTSKYGIEPYEFHFVPTVKYAKILAKELQADEEIVEIAAWIHDIGSIMIGRVDHHITGAKIAEEKLREFGYPEEKIQLVKNCILHHRGSQKMELETKEEHILAEADAMSAFNDITGLFQAAFVYEKMTREDAKESILQKLENKWNQLKSEKSKEIIRPKYDAIKILFDNK